MLEYIQSKYQSGKPMQTYKLKLGLFTACISWNLNKWNWSKRYNGLTHSWIVPWECNAPMQMQGKICKRGVHQKQASSQACQKWMVTINGKTFFSNNFKLLKAIGRNEIKRLFKLQLQKDVDTANKLDGVIC